MTPADGPGDAPAGGGLRADDAGGVGPLGGVAAGGDSARALGGVEVETVDDVTAVRFWGSVDLEVRSRGTGALGALRASSAPVTVDCRDVTFMDSTGLSVLVRVVRDATADGRPVHFLGAGEQVAELLRLTGVDVWMSRLGVQDRG